MCHFCCVSYPLFTSAGTYVGSKCHYFFLARQTNLYVVSDHDCFRLQIDHAILNRDVTMILQSLLHLQPYHSTFDFTVARHICNCLYFKQHNQRALFT
jgi:hypothetical protein